VSKYRMCRYWRMAFGNDSSKAQHIRPGSWA
jgi:hypothetical protein